MKKIFLLFCISLLLLNISYSQCNPDAGLDESICGNTYTFNATLGDAGSTGIWSTNQTGVVFSDINDPAATVIISPIPTLPVEFYWTENNTIIPCSDIDTVIITFLEIPVIDAGPRDTVCGHWVQLNATTAGYQSLWSWWVSGGILFASGPDIALVDTSNLHNNNSWLYNSTLGDSLELFWHECNGVCCSVDSVMLLFDEQFPAVHLVDTSSALKECGLTTTVLNAQTPQLNTTGYWYDETYGTVCYPTAHMTNPNYAVVSNYGTHNFHWVLVGEFGICRDTTAAIPVTFLEQPVADAGTDQVVCGNTTQLDAFDPTVGIGHWNGPDCPTCSFPNIYDPNSILYNAIAAGFGTYNIIWTVINDICTDVDTVVITFDDPIFIYGSILNNSLTLGTGDVEIEAHNNNSGIYYLSAYDSILTNNMYGLYILGYSAIGDYILKARVLNQPAYPNALDTYYDNAYLWENAQTLSLTCGDSVLLDINLVQTTPFSLGNGKVSGTITYDATGDPVVDATFFIEDTTINHPYLQTNSDITGYYEFDDLPAGNFEILVDIPGIPQITTHLFSVTATDTLFENYNYYVDTVLFRETGVGIYADTSQIIYSISKTQFFEVVSVYPNPVSDKLYVKINKNDQKEINIKLINGKGDVIGIDDCTMRNSNVLEYNMKDLSAGVYFICLKIENEIFIKKIVKN